MLSAIFLRAKTTTPTYNSGNPRDMKKTPTIFDRDWNGDRSRVVNVPHPDCGWVFAGEGVATLKMDGTCCMWRDGALWKRRELRKGEIAPAAFEIADVDDETGKTVGWVPVGEGPEDRWHREARDKMINPEGGTYELVGPKIQGNPEKYPHHELVRHGHMQMIDAPRSFDELRDYLSRCDVEGIVWHHPDGRMGKIKKRDFGLKR